MNTDKPGHHSRNQRISPRDAKSQENAQKSFANWQGFFQQSWYVLFGVRKLAIASRPHTAEGREPPMDADPRRRAAPNIGVHPRSSAVSNNCACSISLLS